MKPRMLVLCLLCVCALGNEGLSFGQARKELGIRQQADVDDDSAGVERHPIRIARPATLERRVQDLEKQVQVLAGELQALRKEVKPLANQPGRPRLLKALPSDVPQF